MKYKDFLPLQNPNRIKEPKNKYITLMCTPKTVKNLRWAVAITLHELREDLKEAERVENSGAIARNKEAIKEFEAILNALPNSPII